MFSFKRAGISEIPLIQQIAYNTRPSAYHSIIGEEQVSYMLDLIYNNESLTKHFIEGHYFYFVYRNDELVGFASFGQMESAVWKLYEIYILPSVQGSGAGKSLLNFIFRKVLSLGGTELILNVNRKNKALAFFKVIGFTIIREVKIDIDKGFYMDEYIMSLPLEREE